MPFSSKKLKKILALKNISWDNAGHTIINHNHQINEAIHLFEKIENEKIKEQLTKLKF